MKVVSEELTPQRLLVYLDDIVVHVRALDQNLETSETTLNAIEDSDKNQRSMRCFNRK